VNTIRPLIQAICACADDVDLLGRFLRDVLADADIASHAQRWEVAKRLLLGESAREIEADNVASDKVITRVARWTFGNDATGGFYGAAVRLHLPIPPDILATGLPPKRPRKPRVRKPSPAHDAQDHDGAAPNQTVE